MTNIEKYFKWFYALTKRLLKKPSFILILLFIPLITFAVKNAVTTQHSGIITCVLASDDENDTIYNNVKHELMNESSAILFKEAPNREAALELVKSGEADCAWIFRDKLDKKIERFVLSKTIRPHLADVILKEDSVFYKLSREKLYSYLYKALSYDVFHSYMKDRFPNHSQVNDENLERLYTQARSNLNSDIIQLSFLGEPQKKLEDTNYLLSPLKGLLSVAMLLTVLASVMYSLQDETNGKYALFPKSRRLFLHFSSALSAGIIVSIAIFAARFLSGDMGKPLFEAVSMIVYIMSCSAFCVFVGIVCKTPKRMCISFPIIILCSLIFCPIFINLSSARMFSLLIPGYYYLMAQVDSIYLWYGAAYCIIGFIICNVMYAVRCRE